jgi:hypothetical protein
MNNKDVRKISERNTVRLANTHIKLTIHYAITIALFVLLIRRAVYARTDSCPWNNQVPDQPRIVSCSSRRTEPIQEA